MLHIKMYHLFVIRQAVNLVVLSVRTDNGQDTLRPSAWLSCGPNLVIDSCRAMSNGLERYAGP